MPGTEANTSFFTDSPTITAEGDVNTPSSTSQPSNSADATNVSTSWFSPFPNPSISRLLQWAYSGSSLKSGAELQRLVDDVVSAPDFDKEHLRGVNIRREELRLDRHEEDTGIFSAASGWRSGTVSLRVPKEGATFSAESDAPRIEIGGIQYRSLTGVIRAAYEDASAKLFSTLR